MISVFVLLGIGTLFLWPRHRVLVETVSVQKGDVEEILTPLSNAMVRAERHALVKGGTAGEVMKRCVEKGARVEKGAVIIELKNEDPRARLELAEANLKTGVASSNQTKIRSASVKRELERATELLNSELMSEANFEKVQAESNFTAEAVSAQQATLSQLAAQLKIARSLYDATVLRAPFGGIVADIFVGEGESVVPGMPVYEIFDRDTMEVTAHFDEIDAARLRPGMQARITADAIAGRVFPGKVVWISPVVSTDLKAGRGVEVRFSLEDEDAQIRLGMSVDLEVVADVRPDARFVPTAVILGEEGKRFVYVVRKGRIEKRRITPGLSNWDRTEVLDGLGDEERVVSTVNLPGLKEGIRVDVAS
jgi:HlyD family secretion protein